MVKKDWILFLALLCIGATIAVSRCVWAWASIHRPGIGIPAFLHRPRFESCSVWLPSQCLLGAKKEGRDETDKLFGPSIRNVVAIFAALVIYVFLFGLLRFLG
jgi:hypothetical protein